MFVVANDAQQLQVWDRASGKVTSPVLPAGQYIAENSELRWTADGKSLAFAMRNNAWKERAKKRFDELTNGPITVLDGSDDFLEWDDMNRMNQERSIVLWDVGAPAVRTIQPEGRIGTWLLSKDGASVTVQQDITKKTDYDVIGGREFQLVTRAHRGRRRAHALPIVEEHPASVERRRIALHVHPRWPRVRRLDCRHGASPAPWANDPGARRGGSRRRAGNRHERRRPRPAREGAVLGHALEPGR